MTILITGGSKGIGRGIAERFARDGAHVLISYSSDDTAAEDARQAVDRAGGTATLIKLDLSTPEGVTALGAAVADATDTLDQIVYGAVWPKAASPLEITVQEFAKAAFMNGGSLLATVQELRPFLHRGSSIYQISSRGSKLAVPNYIAIGAPKALGEAIVRYLAVALAPDGIRINTISCSGVLTDAIRAIRPDAEERATRLAAINPSGRNVEPKDVAELIHALSAPAMEMVTGREFFVDGGQYITTAVTSA